VAYLDDLYILNKAQGSLQAAKEVLDQSPFRLNLLKSQERPIQALKSEGIKALGTFIGPIAQRQGFLQGKINTLKSALEALQDLPKQHSLLLLRGSIQLLLRHLQRQLDPIGLDHLWGEIDSLIQQAIKAILARRPSDLPKDPNPDLIAIPVREGGLGIPLYKDLAKNLFQAAREASEPVLEKIRASLQLPYIFSRDPSPKIRKTAQEVLKATNRARLACFLETCPTSYQQARLENASYLGRKWLSVLPTRKDLSFADTEITEALRSRLFYPIKPTSLPCNHCGSIPAFGHEDTCKGANRRWIARHDAVTRAFYKALSSQPTLEAEKEPLV
jgi:hypothetical protein